MEEEQNPAYFPGPAFLFANFLFFWQNVLKMKKVQLFLKRILDIFGSLIGIIFLFLPLFLPIALAIKLNSKGPVIIKLERISQGKKIFIHKFRTMYQDAAELKPIFASLNERDGPFFKIKHDPRITKVGGFLRKYHLDEIPQFFDVLLGKISLVGPRAHEPQEIFFYPKEYLFIVKSKAGLTGLSQISGGCNLSFLKELEIDKKYLQNWSLLLDLKILFKTFFLFLLGKLNGK